MSLSLISPLNLTVSKTSKIIKYIHMSLSLSSSLNLSVSKTSKIIAYLHAYVSDSNQLDYCTHTYVSNVSLVSEAIVSKTSKISTYLHNVFNASLVSISNC